MEKDIIIILGIIVIILLFAVYSKYKENKTDKELARISSDKVKTLCKTKAEGDIRIRDLRKEGKKVTKERDNLKLN